MTYLGTRPILPDELEQYELHHRARIAIKPGITGMWQVSGRSDITDLPFIGSVTARRLIEKLGDAEKIYQAGSEQLAEISDGQ